MKITHLNEYVTAVPHIPSIEKSRPGDYRERPISIIEVHTDEGIVGIGEGGRGQSFSEAEKEWEERNKGDGAHLPLQRLVQSGRFNQRTRCHYLAKTSF